MSDCNELMEAALESRPDGIALLGKDGEIVFWNQAAEAITGYQRMEMLAQPVPAGLEQLLLDTKRGTAVEAHHKLGHLLRAMAQRTILRDPFGQRIGAAVVFHPAESLDALPHGESTEGEAEQIAVSQMELEERLHAEFDDLAHGGPPFGILWVSVDQAEELHKTHGAAGSQAMLDKVRRALGQALRPAEQMGRWGASEFLIVAHERSAEMLALHGQTLAGQARTADFRWWGDRVSVTVSIGAAQAECSAEESLTQLLERARNAMESAHDAGGNRVVLAAKGVTCSPS
jgi:diguanylate cyclase (GGDEF)-like protein